MIKSIITVPNPDKEPERYPCLKVHTDGTVVLFTQVSTGTIVSSLNPNIIGHHDSDFKASEYKFLSKDRKVELSNV